MSKVVKSSIMFLITAVIISLCGCNEILTALTTKTVPEEELVIIFGRNDDNYVYSKAVLPDSH